MFVLKFGCGTKWSWARLGQLREVESLVHYLIGHTVLVKISPCESNVVMVVLGSIEFHA
jgi:hypothetical protein